MLNENSPLMNTYKYLPVNLVRGNGSLLYDDKGKSYIDFTSGIGVNSLGYNHKDWVLAVQESASTLQHCSNIFLNERVYELAEKLTKLSGMSKVFFANSGAEANEGAFKLARKYSFLKYGKNRNKILSLKNSFHGRTLATLKATGQEKFHNYFFPFPEGFQYVEVDLATITETLTSDVCAIIVEGIQGEGGVYPQDKNFITSLEKICAEKDILLIFDEIQTGIGRTGKLFSYEHFNIKPDIVTFAKGLGGGLPIGGFLCNKKLQNVFNPGDHGTTFGGNPVACSGALAVLKNIANEKALREIEEKGSFLTNLLKNISSPHIKAIRGMGLMLGIEVDLNISSVQKKALEEGLLVLTASTNVIRLLPPLIISKEEIEKCVEILKKIFESWEE